MKRTLWHLILPVIVCFVLPACSKNDSKGSNSTKATVVLSDNNVKKGQLVVATAPSGITGDVKWSVNTAYARVTTSSGQALVQFAQGGTYHITATYNSGHDSSASIVYVSDSVYAPVVYPGYDTLSLAGESVLLTPFTDSAGNLLMQATSAHSYDCYPTFVWGWDFGPASAPSFGLRFYEIIAGNMNGTSCNGVKNPASTLVFAIPPKSLAWGNGTFPFTVTMNNTTYSGSLTISSTGYSFDWNYTAGVTINPKQISR